MPAAPRVKCPSCSRESEWDPANRWRPFCSERCRLVDLGAWLDGRHAIAGEPTEPFAQAEPADARPH